MGHSIAQLFALNGFQVSLFDVDRRALDTVPGRIRRNLAVCGELGLAAPEDADSCLANIRLCPQLDRACHGVHLVIEAAPENLGLKRKLFAEVEGYVTPETILSSNTSAISITKISESLENKSRMLGTHFWNPPHIVPCVEVIRSEFTDPQVYETVFALMEKLGKEPVRVLKDVPGFLGNRMQHALWREAVALVERGIASAEDVDRVVKYSFGLRLPFIGPLETADLAGLDLTLDVHKDLFPHLENSTEPSPLLIQKVDHKELGVKTGEGFHAWTAEKAAEAVCRRDRFLLKLIQEILPQER